MTEAAPSPDSTPLSESLEAAVYSACFGAEPDVALATLVASRPGARAAIESLALRVRRAAGCLQDANRAIPAESDPPPTMIGPYQVLRELGRGGFGRVYLVEQREPIRRRLALKVLRSDFPTDELLRRFEGERQVLASMNHPGIATIVEAGRTSIGQPFLAMEWIEGPPITTFADHKRLSVRERLQLFLGVCSAVAHAHQRGVLHRDLKPANILIADPDGQPLPKVIDFGLAKLRSVEAAIPGTAATRDGSLLGTPEYMSPEQARGEQLDSRTDVYALGAVLYELLTGRLPFLTSQLLAEGLASVAQVLTEQRAPSASRAVGDETAARNRGLTPTLLARRLRGDLDAVVACCLERDREARYENVAALTADLRRLLAGDPVTVARPSALRLLRDFGRRHRLLSSAVLAISLGGLIAATATTWSLWRVSEARRASSP